MLCIWKSFQSKYKAPFNIWQWKQNTCKTLIILIHLFEWFLFVCLFTGIVLHMKFAFLRCWNVFRWDMWKDRSTLQNNPTSACCTAYRMSAEILKKKNRKRYVQPPVLASVNILKRLSGETIEWLPLYNATYFHFLIWFFPFSFFKHTNNSHYIILPN